MILTLIIQREGTTENRHGTIYFFLNYMKGNAKRGHQIKDIDR